MSFSRLPFLGPSCSRTLTVTVETTAQMREVCSGDVLFTSPLSDLSAAFLSYLRLSIYMAIVSIAIMVSFHLKNQPSALELRMALPLGLIFWALSLACLALGFGNYIKTVTKYSRRAALVQTGWKTQVVSCTLLEVCHKQNSAFNFFFANAYFQRRLQL